MSRPSSKFPGNPISVFCVILLIELNKQTVGKKHHLLGDADHFCESFYLWSCTIFWTLGFISSDVWLTLILSCRTTDLWRGPRLCRMRVKHQCLFLDLFRSLCLSFETPVCKREWGHETNFDPVWGRFHILLQIFTCSLFGVNTSDSLSLSVQVGPMVETKRGQEWDLYYSSEKEASKSRGSQNNWIVQ